MKKSSVGYTLTLVQFLTTSETEKSNNREFNCKNENPLF